MADEPKKYKSIFKGAQIDESVKAVRDLGLPYGMLRFDKENSTIKIGTNTLLGKYTLRLTNAEIYAGLPGKISFSRSNPGTSENSIRLANIATPIDDSDAATKQYVDAKMVDSAHLAKNAVHSDNIADEAVTESKLDQAVKDKLNSAGGLTEAKADERYLKLTGGKMSGDVTLEGGLNDTPAVNIINQGTGDFASLQAATLVLGRDKDNDGTGGHVRIDHSQGKLHLSHSPGFDPAEDVIVEGVKTPVNDTDAANKEYVDSKSADALTAADERYLKLTQGGTIASPDGTASIAIQAFDKSNPTIKTENTKKGFSTYLTAQGIWGYNESNPDAVKEVSLYPDQFYMMDASTAYGFIFTHEEPGKDTTEEDLLCISSASGGLMRVKIIDPADPVADNDVTTKKYVDDAIAAAINALRAELQGSEKESANEGE